VFDYHRPSTLDETLALLSGDDDVLVIAGGQSLIPAMNFRMANPATLVDIGRLPGLDQISVTEQGIDLGATVRHRAVELSDDVYRVNPILRMALEHVAHVPIRHRGTTVGSLCQADAAAEMPMLLVLTGGYVVAQNQKGARQIPAEDFFTFHMTTSRAPDELVVSAHFPALPTGAGCGFQEFARRRGDYALSAVGAIVVMAKDGRVEFVRLAACGISNKPTRLHAAEDVLLGQFPDEQTLRRAGEAAADYVTAPDDSNASNTYRKHLTSGLLGRTVLQAIEGGKQ